MIYGADLVYERCDKEKVRALARTVRSGLSSVPWPSIPATSGAEHDPDEDVVLSLAVPAFPCFLLALTRRSFPLPQLLALFREEGLGCDGLLENGCWDIFENETDGMTDMWRDVVLGFTPLEVVTG